MKPSEYLQHDAVGLAALVARGETTAQELLEFALRQAAAAQPKTNAICRMMQDEARGQLKKQLKPRMKLPLNKSRYFIMLTGGPEDIIRGRCFSEANYPNRWMHRH